MTRGKTAERRSRRMRRHARIQKTIRGTAHRPRLVVSRSLRHIEGQLVNDDLGATIMGLSSRSSAVADAIASDDDKVAVSFATGKLLAERAVEQGIEQAVFDRAGYPYQGRVEAFADGAREGGLEF